jgi:hypothetical protein
MVEPYDVLKNSYLLEKLSKEANVDRDLNPRPDNAKVQEGQPSDIINA